jgi:hypothetical protein
VADIFRQHGTAYRAAHALPLGPLRVMRAIEVCRTAALGGHIEKCSHCDCSAPELSTPRNADENFISDGVWGLILYPKSTTYREFTPWRNEPDATLSTRAAFALCLTKGLTPKNPPN